MMLQVFIFPSNEIHLKHEREILQLNPYYHYIFYCLMTGKFSYIDIFNWLRSLIGYDIFKSEIDDKKLHFKSSKLWLLLVSSSRLSKQFKILSF